MFFNVIFNIKQLKSVKNINDKQSQLLHKTQYHN